MIDTIDMIDIRIQNGINETFHAMILYYDKICYIDDKKYNLSDEYLDNLLGTIRLWKNEYGNDDKIDSEEFTISIKINENEEIFHGKGIFPDNYRYFKELLGDIHD